MALKQKGVGGTMIPDVCCKYYECARIQDFNQSYFYSQGNNITAIYLNNKNNGYSLYYLTSINSTRGKSDTIKLDH